MDLSHEDVDFDSKAGHADQPEAGISLYGAADFTDHFFGFAVGRVGLFEYDTKRDLTINITILDPPEVTQTSVKGSTDGYNLGIGGGIGYSFLELNNVVLNASGSLSYFYESYGNYKEDAFSAANIDNQFDYDSFSDDSFVSTLEVAAGFPLRVDAITIMPTFSAAWVHEFITDTETRTVNAISPSFGDAVLEYPINKPDEDHAEPGPGWRSILEKVAGLL